MATMHKTKMATLLFLVSESIFFILLILTYLFYHGRTVPHLQSQNFLNASRTGTFTFVLLTSSITMALALKSFRRHHFFRSCLWIFLTLALGGFFLYGQACEWLGLLKQNLSISRDLFGASFFTLTGFHSLHVLVGMLLLFSMLILTGWRGRERVPESSMDSISLYWHFVDGVWIVVFSVIYLAPLMNSR